MRFKIAIRNESKQIISFRGVDHSYRHFHGSLLIRRINTVVQESNWYIVFALLFVQNVG